MCLYLYAVLHTPEKRGTRSPSKEKCKVAQKSAHVVLERFLN